MYEYPRREDLWQGDVIVGGVFPVLTTLRFNDDGEVDTNVRIKRVPFALISHSCDLELHNGQPKRIAFQISPLAQIPRSLQRHPEALEILRRHDPVDPDTPTYLNLFLYHSADGSLSSDMVLDLSVIYSLPSSPNVFAELRRHKALELTAAIRARLQEKLMLQYGRDFEQRL